MTIATVTVDVDVDLSDVEVDDLITEIESRGGGEFGGESLNDCFAVPRMRTWLAQQNPPQEVRDAYYATHGRMLL